ncbi:hypothetical protein C7999DRAFT_39166 [Corynascus novoguineensis]|uniref:2EXR domain-containing protein n=1 Tax=Corynascus novoguineensis TaxID=1126955 RepID=A0AAN7CZL5_9PEZI|nr:hypothetical protein C7999DRAFT_39166 [Corynascus novoguineensis]
MVAERGEPLHLLVTGWALQRCTFHIFPLLPFELRSWIWKSTVEPRTVEVRVGGPAICRKAHVLISLTPVPATLQTCREAPNLNLYEQAFSETNTERRYVWVNWDLDIISIGTSYFDHFHTAAPLIKRLKFERQNTCEFFYTRKAWHDAIAEHYPYWHCGEENLYLIDPEEGGRMMKATELGAMMDQEYREIW